MSRRADGFTLVELIVVIAILAILATIAVPQYSKYVEKAQIGADQTLVSNIIHAGLVHHYSNSIGAASAPAGTVLGYVVVSDGGTTVGGDGMDDAMKEAFGDSYATELKLEWDGWTGANGYGDLASSTVADSSYAEAGAGQLLGDVQNCATSLGNFLANGNLLGETGMNVLDHYLGGGTYVKDYLGQMKPEDMTADVLSNAVVFGMADKLTQDPGDTQDKFANGYYLLRNWKTAPDGYNIYNSNNLMSSNAGDPDLLVEAASTYAAMEALASYMEIPLGVEFDPTDNKLSILTDLEAACNDLLNRAGAKDADKLQAYLQGGSNGELSQAAKDAQAYMDVMGTVSDLKNDYYGNLSSNNLFGSSDVKNRVNGYLAVSNMGEDVKNAMDAAVSGASSAVSMIYTVAADGSIGCTVYSAEADPRY